MKCINKQKTLLKHIAVHWQKGTSKVLVGALDYSYNVVVDPIQINNFCKTGMTYHHFSAMRSVFSKYIFDSNSTVLLPRDIPTMHPCNIWLMTLKTQLSFNLIYKDMSDIIKRLLKLYCSLIPIDVRKRKIKCKIKNNIKEKYSLADFNYAWNKLIKYEVCPWINNQTNIQLFSNNSSTDYLRMQKIYVALYYMMVRKHYIDKNKEYSNKVNIVQ